MKNDPKNFRAFAAVTMMPRADAIQAWDSGLVPVAMEGNAIEIFDVIGDSFFDSGVTLKDVTDQLAGFDGADVNVYINTPGGDVFEGVAIANALRAYDGEVNVKILGLAASAGAIIAVAGDNIEIAETAQMMIHKAWSVVIGNSDDLSEVIERLDRIDADQAKVFTAQMGISTEEVMAMLSAETFMSGPEAVEKGLADKIMPGTEVKKSESKKAKAKRACVMQEAALMQAYPKMSRGERREIMKNSGKPSAAKTSTPGAAETTTPSAGDQADLAAQMIKLADDMKAMAAEG